MYVQSKKKWGKKPLFFHTNTRKNCIYIYKLASQAITHSEDSTKQDGSPVYKKGL